MKVASTLRYLDYCEDIRTTRDIVYGEAKVGYSNGVTTTRLLRLDVYEPADLGGTKGIDRRPALILAFGGAFHRGSKEDDSYRVDGHFNTTVAKYCQAFARRGYVTFSVDYRLAPEDPVPGSTPVVATPKSIPRSRVDYVRELLGLPPATMDLLWRSIEAASDDFAMAFDFVHDNADRWAIDVERIAVGGFSAGARSALNVAFGEHKAVAAIVSLSGYMALDDLQRNVTLEHSTAPVMLVAGEHDLDYVGENLSTMAGHFERVGTQYEAHRIKGATHFYSAHCSITRPDGSRTSLEAAIADFLYRSLNLADMSKN